MVTLTRIYTRGGDSGQTSLGRGERVAKHDPRVEAYGTVDEANSVIGLARSAIGGATLGGQHYAEADAMLARIQNDLFDLGADLAVPERQGKAERLRMLGSQVERLERDIDGLNARLAPLTSFVLPGGTPAAAHLHLARTICRRAERIMVELAAKPDEPVSDAGIQYMNRLSDFLFVASRSVNDNGAGDVLWVPGQNR
jgi:cob(I)alamin adenosyltransferase